jgi:membrane-associated protease RseP (regulator of RpoE activity)
MKTVKPNSTLLLHTDEGMISVTIQPHPINRSQGVIGINIFEYYPPKFSWMPKQLPYHLYITAYWMNTILISVALINMLPIYPLDGGRVVTSLLHMFKIRNVDKIKIIISIVSLGILAANLLLSISRFGFGKI